MRADIEYLDDALLRVYDLPHRNICRTAFFQMAVMTQIVKLAVIGPVPTDWPLGCQLLGEHQVPLTDGMRQRWICFAILVRITTCQFMSIRY